MMKHTLKGAGIMVGVSLFFACNQGQQDQNAASSPDAVAVNVDTTVSPRQDYFDYANGGWIKQNPIPPEYNSWGIGNLVREEIYKRLLIINEKAAENPADPISKKIAAFWKSAMDSTQLNADGIKPIAPMLKAIDEATSIDQLVQLSARHSEAIGTMGALYIGQDAKNSEVMAVQFYQGGLGLPNRDYYFNTDPRTTNIRNAYPAHISKMLQFTGMDSTASKKAAEQIIKLETLLAKSSRKLEMLRDPEANYHKMPIADLTKMAGNINWAEYIKDQGITKFADTVIVGQPEFFVA
jgi:putative endopeptidase